MPQGHTKDFLRQVWSSASPRSPALTSAPSPAQGPIRAAGPRASLRPRLRGCAHLGHRAAAFAEHPETSNCKIRPRPQRGHCPGRARPPPPPLTGDPVGSEEPVLGLGSPSPPAGPQGRPDERSCPDHTRRTRLWSEGCRRLGSPLQAAPHSPGPAGTRPCRWPRVSSLRSTALLPRAQAGPAVTLFPWVRLCFCRRATKLLTHTPRSFLPVRAPRTASPGVSVLTVPCTRDAHTCTDDHGAPQTPSGLTQQGRPEESGRLPSPVQSARAPVLRPL